MNHGQNDAAERLAEQAVAVDRTNALGWLVLGTARQLQRDLAGARAAYEACIRYGTNASYVRECRTMLP